MLRPLAMFVLLMPLCAQTPTAAEFHGNVVKLVEISGTRQRMEQGMSQTLEMAKEALRKAQPNAAPEFAEEWARRMKARINFDDYISAVVKAYEAHLENQDVLELIAATEAQLKGETVQQSARLQQKLAEKLPAIMGQITGATTELGAKLGGEIGAELEKEHPEYFQRPPASK